jgi:hypothetical protein
MVMAAVGIAASALPAFAQPASGHAFAGHAVAAHPMGPAHSIGTPVHSGQRTGAIHANSFGASSAPPPSWELPKNVTPHWEIGPNVHVQPNPVQGNHIPRTRGGFGVGYVGFPYYADPMAFVDANGEDDTGTNAGQQPQPNAPVRPDYAPQAPYAEGAYDGGYPPPRAPYNPQAYSPPQQPQQNSAAAESDGLDHPAVTLVFNDGRPPMKVHSYVLTGSSVFVAESGHQRIIPVADLNLPATIAQNREAGVDFQLPGGSR